MSEPLSAERLRELHRRCSDCYADYCESLETQNARLREQREALAAALERDERIARTAFVASAGCPHAGMLARIWLGRN